MIDLGKIDPRSGPELLEGIPHIPKLDRISVYYSDFPRHYAAMAAQIKPKRVLEIGVRLGYAMCSMVKAWRGIDFYLGVDCEVEISNSNKLAEENICAAGYKGNLLLWSMTSKDAVEKIKKLGGWFDLAHIDGNHDEFWAYHDTLNFWSFVKPSGYMIVDDVANPDGDSIKLGVEKAKLEMTGIKWEGIKAQMFTGALVMQKSKEKTPTPSEQPKKPLPGKKSNRPI